MVAYAAIAAAAAPPLETMIGMEGTYFLRYGAPNLDVKPFDDAAPIILRLITVTPVTDAAEPAFLYELRYVGLRAGGHDLREYLIAGDGNRPQDVEPMEVSIRELLPPDHGGDLDEFAAPPMPSVLSYRTLIRIAAVLWALPAAWYLMRRLIRPKSRPTVATDRPPTTAESLQRLVDKALRGPLDVDERAQLERLLIHYWRECLDAGAEPTTELLKRMSGDPRTTELVRRLEEWLYRRPAASAIDVAELLAPYRQVAAAGSSR